MATKTSTFKERPIITLQNDKISSLSFGVEKARLIIENLSDIVAFVDEHKAAKGE